MDGSGLPLRTLALPGERKVSQPAVSPNSIRQRFDHPETQPAFTASGLEIRDSADWQSALRGQGWQNPSGLRLPSGSGCAKNSASIPPFIKCPDRKAAPIL